MSKDFGSGQGDVQGVGPNTAAPRTSGTPKTGFDEPAASTRAEHGPGPGVKGNTKKIK